MLAKHNVFREMENLSPFIENDLLNAIAFKHAKRMARLCWLHENKLIDSFTTLTDYDEIVWNLALGSNPEIAVKKLINLPESRYKILGNYQHFGFGSYKGRNDIRYWCLLYGRLK